MTFGILTIPDADFITAVGLIDSGVHLGINEIDTIVRTYIEDGVNGSIVNDFGSASVSEHTAIVAKLVDDTGGLFTGHIIPSDIEVTLTRLSSLGAQGLVNQYISNPVQWSQKLKAGLQASHATSKSETVLDSISDVFSSIGSGAQTVVKGTLSALGIDLQTLLIIAVIGVLIILYFRSK